MNLSHEYFIAQSSKTLVAIRDSFQSA